jgi:DNA polymerase epsilon subunit 1
MFFTSITGKTISKTIDDYEGRKSTSLTTAARLADFLGSEMTRDKGTI